MTAELKPCPFCGRAAMKTPVWRVTCSADAAKEEFCPGTTLHLFDRQWNTRAEMPQVADDAMWRHLRGFLNGKSVGEIASSVTRKAYAEGAKELSVAGLVRFCIEEVFWKAERSWQKPNAEAVAEAMYRDAQMRQQGRPYCAWERLTTPARDEWIACARAAIAAMQGEP